jgi:hypothetical protein
VSEGLGTDEQDSSQPRPRSFSMVVCTFHVFDR